MNRCEPIEVSFDSGGVPCAASLYRPTEEQGPVPCLVMGHGTSGTRDLGLLAYAERFAAADARIAAVVSQVPWVGVEFARSSPRSRQATRQLFVAAFKDALRGLFRRPPSLIKVVGHPGEVAAFTDPDAREWMDALACRAPSWRNAFAARVLFSMLWYRPGRKAKQLAMPLLVCIADQDTAGSTTLALRAAKQAPRSEVRHYPLTHFAAYVGKGFEQMVVDQVQFLRTHLFMPAHEPSLAPQAGSAIIHPS